jgi:hypothetical protein
MVLLYLFILKFDTCTSVAIAVTAHLITNLDTGPAALSNIRVLYGYPRVLSSADTVP